MGNAPPQMSIYRGAVQTIASETPVPTRPASSEAPPADAAAAAAPDVWRLVFELPQSTEDVFATWTMEDVKKLVYNSEGNAKKLSEEALRLVAGRFPRDGPPKAATTYLNAVRTVTRLTPTAFEKRAKSSSSSTTGTSSSESKWWLLEDWDVPRDFVGERNVFDQELAAPRVEEARLEVLRLWLATLSEPIWSNASPLPNLAGPETFEDVLVTDRVALVLLRALVQHAPENSWLASSASLFRRSATTWIQTTTGEYAVCVLAALLDNSWGPGGSLVVNQYQEAVRKALLDPVESGEPLGFPVFDALMRYLASSAWREALVLVWRLFDTPSGDFLRVVVSNAESLRLLDALLHVIFTARRVNQLETATGSMQVAFFILLLLVSEREFCIQLNAELIDPPVMAPEFKLPFILGPNANRADLLIAVLHKFLLDSDKIFAPLHRVAMTILLNISPYVKTLRKESSQRLTQLLERYSSERFLLAAEDNHQFLFFLLESFSNMIGYQSEGQASLLYALCRSRTLLESVADLRIPDEGETPAARVRVEDAEGATATRFYPTQEWLESWKARLPVSAVYRAVTYLEPKVDGFIQRQNASGAGFDEDTIRVFIKSQTLIGVIPLPAPIVSRKHQKSMRSDHAVRAYFWTAVFLRSFRPENAWPSVWDGADPKSIKLFVVKSEEAEKPPVPTPASKLGLSPRSGEKPAGFAGETSSETAPAEAAKGVAAEPKEAGEKPPSKTEPAAEVPETKGAEEGAAA